MLAPKRDNAMLDLLQNILVVLVRPRFPENIGAAARVVANMGLGGLRVVSPLRLWDDPMRRLARENGRPVLDAMSVSDTLEEALCDCVAAAAYTARTGYKRGRLINPKEAAPQVMTWAKEGKAALVFGPEDRGLNTEELDCCFLSVCIPTAEAAALNLAQAVVVAAYEQRLAALNAEDGSDVPETRGPAPKPSSLAEFNGLKEHLMQAMVALNVIPADNPEHFFRPFKNVLERAGVSSREVRSLRGIARQILWLGRQIKGKNGKTSDKT